jgi:hypothetical protein
MCDKITQWLFHRDHITHDNDWIVKEENVIPISVLCFFYIKCQIFGKRSKEVLGHQKRTNWQRIRSGLYGDCSSSTKMSWVVKIDVQKNLARDCLFKKPEIFFLIEIIKIDLFLTRWIISTYWIVNDDFIYFLLVCIIRSLLHIDHQRAQAVWFNSLIFRSHITWPWVYWARRWSNILAHVKRKRTLTSLIINRGQQSFALSLIQNEPLDRFDVIKFFRLK